jgi:hypothetical protein
MLLVFLRLLIAIFFLEKLGKGGMGIIYRATDRLNGTSVALKQVLLPAERLQNASSGPTEAEAVGTVTHAILEMFEKLGNHRDATIYLQHPDWIKVIQVAREALKALKRNPTWQYRHSLLTLARNTHQRQHHILQDATHRQHHQRETKCLFRVPSSSDYVRTRRNIDPAVQPVEPHAGSLHHDENFLAHGNPFADDCNPGIHAKTR